MPSEEPLLVFLAALATAAATGLGALPFLAVPRMSRHWIGLANALAAGLMVAASLSLLVEGARLGLVRTGLGFLLGAVLIRLSHVLIERHGELDIGALHGADARKALLIVGVMTLHSFAEGIGVGVAFGGGEELGWFIAIAIALHNVPEGLAISLVLIPRGVSVPMAAWWSVFSSLPQPIMALPAYLMVTVTAAILPAGFGLAAGAMLWMTWRELIPEARLSLPTSQIALAILLSAGTMLGVQTLVLHGTP